MKSVVLRCTPEPELAAELEKFERAFTYPLGADRRFFISHGADYSRFYRAIDGQSGAVIVVRHREGRVLGTLGLARRPLRFPDGQIRHVAYLGDLKIAPGLERGRVLMHLATIAQEYWAALQDAKIGYGIVMDGTTSLPPQYTGRLGLPPFRKLEQLAILRLPIETGVGIDPAYGCDTPIADKRFACLSTGAFAALGGEPAERSEFSPVPLASPDDTACGLLEDTMRAKRLFALDGREIRSAHLAQFAYRDPEAGVRLLRQAVARCAASHGAPALFVALPRRDLPDFQARLAGVPGVVVAGATVYGTGFDTIGEPWHIATSEI